MSHSYNGSISRILAKSYKFRSGISIAPSELKKKKTDIAPNRSRLFGGLMDTNSSDCVSRAWLHMTLSVKEIFSDGKETYLLTNVINPAIDQRFGMLN